MRNQKQKNDAGSRSAEKKLPAGNEEKPRPVEKGGPAGPEPTRYGDWERNGKCVDF